MTPEQIKDLREHLGWSKRKAAAKFKVGYNTWRTWEEKPVRRHPIHEDRLKDLYKYAFGKEASECPPTKP